jgi:hypothetical protein
MRPAASARDNTGLLAQDFLDFRGLGVTVPSRSGQKMVPRAPACDAQGRFAIRQQRTCANATIVEEMERKSGLAIHP